MLPVVTFDQVFAFDSASLVKSLPKPSNVAEKQFRTTASDVFERIIQMADNAGATDEHRALNYLAVRYPKIYERATEAHAAGVSVTAVDVRPSRLSGVRTILNVIFSYTDRKTDVTSKEFVRVDVTEEFPFLVTKLSPYYDR
jgi:cyclic patellamide precursor peptide PatG